MIAYIQIDFTGVHSTEPELWLVPAQAFAEMIAKERARDLALVDLNQKYPKYKMDGVESMKREKKLQEFIANGGTHEKFIEKYPVKESQEELYLMEREFYHYDKLKDTILESEKDIVKALSRVGKKINKWSKLANDVILQHRPEDSAIADQSYDWKSRLILADISNEKMGISFLTTDETTEQPEQPEPTTGT